MAMATDAPQRDATDAKDTCQGVWLLSGGEADGKMLTARQLQGGKLVINGDQYTVTMAEQGTVTGTQKLDATQQPKTIDIVNADGPQKGQPCFGIYELEGNEFRVVFASPGGARPTSFETTPGSGQWMHVWTRVEE
jgi:uncharacterized protein (TIGR03067 family)